MAITSDDIKLMQPERLSDDADGGGQMTGLQVVDGDINNLFDDISRINRTYGDVSLRKAFLKVDTPTDDLYLDAHSILSAQPLDPNVTGLLFTTEDFYDERSAARQQVESFVVPGPVTSLQLRGTQLQRQKAIICYAPKVNNVKPPEIGETYMLQTEDDLETRQFIKVLSTEYSSEVFSYVTQSGDVANFTADQYVLRISSELDRDFPAEDPNPLVVNESRIYSTQPAPAAKYYGTTTLASDAEAGATSIVVAETFAPIIPTASSETPVIDQRPGGFIGQVVASGTEAIDISVTVAQGTIVTLPTAIVPGSMSMDAGDTYTDKGGVFVDASGSEGLYEGTTIDYNTGLIQWGGTAPGATRTISYQPGVLRQHLPNTGRIDIDDTNRNFNYVLSLDPKPNRKTFNCSYQYLGKWYELEDDGSGTLVGDGSGQVNYATGSVVLTLQAQPDASSVLFYRWSEGSLYTADVAGSFSDTTPVYLYLSNQQIVAGSVTLSWESGSVAKTATDSLGDGVISGDATGTIDYARGLLIITSASAPDDDWTVDYTHKDQATLSVSNSLPNNFDQSDISLSSAANIEPGSVSFAIEKAVLRETRDAGGILLTSWYDYTGHQLSDNGEGYIIDRRDFVSVGTIDYSTGAITITGATFLKDLTVTVNSATVTRDINGAETKASTKYSAVAGIEHIVAKDINVYYQLAAGTEGAAQDIRTTAESSWKFRLSNAGVLVPGGVVLDIDGDLWFDDGEGRLMRNYDASTGVGIFDGSIDYSSAMITINAYSGRPITASVTPIACLVGDDWSVIKSSEFRTIAAPLRPNGFTVRADNPVDNVQYNGQADNEGVITGDGITGSVELQSGIASLIFPVPVLASSLYYNAVSYKQIPLDPKILGLDPVRLPADGRVPIMRDADILVLTHTQSDLIDTPSDGLVINAGRDKLYDAWIEDSVGVRLAAAQYTTDLDVGTATLATPFSAMDENSDPLSGDLYLWHRVDDMALCTEARIDGTLQLAQPLYHAMPADETWVASAVYLGNLRARVKNWESYTTDPGDYDSEGAPTNAQYNLIAYPVAIDNRGSVPDRWKIKFTSTTSFDLYSEQRGLVSSGSIAADFSPNNPQTATPYFTIKADGWGTGWSTGNTLRFDTDAAAAPLWLIRTVLPGQATVDDDQLKIELRGDHN